MNRSTPLVGLVVFLLEDDPLIGVDVAMSLEEAGAEVDGPHRNETEALAVIDAVPVRHFDAAVLDVDLGNHTCARVARRLQALSVPLVLHTGNQRNAGSTMESLDAPVVTKPAQGSTLVDAIVGCAKRA